MSVLRPMTVALEVLPTPPFPGRPRRHRRWILFATLIAGTAAAGGWRYRVTRPEYRFEHGLRAVANRDWKTAAELADRLHAAGHPDEAHVLRAESRYACKDAAAALDECNQVHPDGGLLHLRAATLSGKCLLDLGE